MTTEKAIEFGKIFLKTIEDEKGSAIYEFVETAVKMMEQQSCKNAINRQSAIFLANDLIQDLPDDERIADMVMAHNEGILEYQTKLSLLPPVTPKHTEAEIQKMQELEQAEIQKAYDLGKAEQPKIGHWIVVSDGYGDNAYICECSECKDTVWVYKDADRKWKYCPNCGCRMKGVE